MLQSDLTQLYSTQVNWTDALRLLNREQSRRLRSVLAKHFYISLTLQRNSTAVTKFELHIDEEVDNDNKLYKWYERSMGRMVHGTNGLHVVRIVRGTNSQWYEKSRHRRKRRWLQRQVTKSTVVSGVTV